MVTRSQKIRLGIFLLLSAAALLITLGVVVAPRFLEIRDVYYIGFRDVSVTGLQEGGAVKYQGLTVGFVNDIYIDPEDIRRVIVEVSLEQGTPIKSDTRAEIAFLGITGLKLIELRGGTNEAEALTPGSFITAGRSVTEEITGRAEVIAEKAEVVLNNLAALTAEGNRERILELSDQLTLTIVELQTLLNNNQESVYRLLGNSARFSDGLDTLTLHFQGILAQLHEFARSDSLKLILGNMAEITESLKKADLVVLFQEINTTLDQTNRMLRDFEITFSKSRTDLVYTIESMKESADYLNQITRLVSEDPSILVRGTKPKDAPDRHLEK